MHFCFCFAHRDIILLTRIFIILKDTDSAGLNMQKFITYLDNWFGWKIIRYCNSDKKSDHAAINKSNFPAGNWGLFLSIISQSVNIYRIPVSCNSICV